MIRTCRRVASLLFCFRELRLCFLRSLSPVRAPINTQLNLGESVTMEDFAQYKAQAKADLTRDTNLDKAADFVAQQKVLLTNPDIPDGLKTTQLKQLNRQVRTWTKKVPDPFRGEAPQVGEDRATDPTKAIMHALVKTLKEEPEEELEAKTPANVRPPKPRVVLTPKPTPTPRRPKPKKPTTPLSGVATLPNTGEFDRILTRSEQDFDRIQKRYQRLKKRTENPESSQPKKKKKTLGKAVKEGLKKGLQEGAKQWLDF